MRPTRPAPRQTVGTAARVPAGTNLKHYRTMEEYRKEIQPIEEETPRIEETQEPPERPALEDFFKHAALYWGWEGQVSMPVPGDGPEDGPEECEEYLLQDGLLYRRV